MPAPPHRAGPVGPRPSASRSTPTSGSRRTTTGSTSAQRIETIYAYRGFDAIDPSDLRGRMRWWGLYTQRKPGIGGGLTGTLEPEELDDKYFMLRVRIDGGRLTSEQLRAIADISTEFGARHRRRHRPAEHPAALDPHRGRAGDLAAARGGRPVDHRGLRRHPARHPRLPAGRRRRRRDHRRHARPSTRRRALHVGITAFSNLPRKFKTAISGCPDHCTVHEINDVAFVGVHRSGRQPGLRPLGRRRPVDQPQARRPARRLRHRGAAARGVGRRHVDLPRLRLPPLAATAPG